MSSSSIKYSAIAQNTYKFINEVTIGNIGDIQDPKSPRIGNFKAIAENNSATATLAYYCPRLGKSTSSSAEKVCYATKEKAYNNTSSIASLGGILGYHLSNFAGDATESIASCEVDGEKYFGFKSCHLVLKTVAMGMSDVTSTTYSKSYNENIIPKCKLNVVKYDAATGTIMAQSYDMEEFIDEAGTIDGSVTGSTKYYWGYWRFIYLDIPKASEDLILAVTVEYPKYDVTVSGSGLQYSLDGVTYKDLTDESQTFKQVEHVFFKNTDTENHSIINGSESNVSVKVGSTYIYIPSENCSLTVS